MKGKEKTFLFAGALRPGCWADAGLHVGGRQQRQKCSDDLLIEEQKKYRRKVARAMRASVGHLNKLLSEEMDKVRCGRGVVRSHGSEPRSSLSSFSCLPKLWLLPGRPVSAWCLPKASHEFLFSSRHALLHFFFLLSTPLRCSFSHACPPILNNLFASTPLFSCLLLFVSVSPYLLTYLLTHQHFSFFFHYYFILHLFSLSQAEAEVTLGLLEAFQGMPLKANCFSQSTPIGLDCLGWKRCVSSSCEYFPCEFSMLPSLAIHLRLPDVAVAVLIFATRALQ